MGTVVLLGLLIAPVAVASGVPVLVADMNGPDREDSPWADIVAEGFEDLSAGYPRLDVRRVDSFVSRSDGEAVANALGVSESAIAVVWGYPGEDGETLQLNLLIVEHPESGTASGLLLPTVELEPIAVPAVDAELPVPEYFYAVSAGLAHFHLGYWRESADLLAMTDGMEAEMPADYLFARHYGLGNALAGLGIVDGTIEELEAAVALQPGNPAALPSLAATYGDIERDREAIEVFSRAIAAMPRAPEPYLGRARSYIDTGMPQEALSDLDTAIELVPVWGEPYMWRGELLLMTGYAEDAAADLETAVELGASPLRGRELLAEAYLQLGMYEDALSTADETIGLDPTDGGAHLLRGEALHGLGEYDDAIESFDRFAEVIPDGRYLALLYRGECHRNAGRAEEAAEDFGTIIDECPIPELVDEARRLLEMVEREL